MKIKLLLIIIGILIIAVLTGVNVYKSINIIKYNELVSFANSFYPDITDNSSINFQIDINPLDTFKYVHFLSDKTDIVKEELIDQYNLQLGTMALKEAEITDLLDQAYKLDISITDNYQPSSYKFENTTVYDHNLFKNASDYKTYLVNYKLYLNNLFTNLKDSRTKQGQFSNPLWGYTLNDLTQLVNSMSDEDKAGQMLFFSFDGLTLTNEQINRYKNLNPGGMIIMNKNAAYTKQLQDLTKQIQKINDKIPMFIPADQEGGPVKRITWDTTAGQKNWSSMSEQELCQLARQRANLLLDLGINMNFSPVADLTNPAGGFINSRTISTNPETVSSKVKTYVLCGQETGIVDTLKHYPGHGSTSLDSHYSLPFVTKNKNDWVTQDAIPFFGNLDTKQIMVGHLVYTSIDRNNPATLSPILITDILKTEWGYKGLIITDDMNMLHNSTGISVSDAELRAINAGNDILIYVGAPISFEDVKSELVNLIKTNQIPKTRIDEAVLKILKAKRDLVY